MLVCFKIVISAMLIIGLTCNNCEIGSANNTLQQDHFSYLSLVMRAVPEIDIPPCRWPHTIGSFTAINYQWGSNLQNPGTLWRTAFESAIVDWNWSYASIKLYFVYSTTGSIIFDTYTLQDNLGGYAAIACSGSTTTGVGVYGNILYDTGNNNARHSTAGHETGHSLSIGHIPGNIIALMGYNPDPTIYFAPQPIDAALVNQIYR
jgi:hypothetical protein